MSFHSLCVCISYSYVFNQDDDAKELAVGGDEAEVDNHVVGPDVLLDVVAQGRSAD